MFPLFRVFLRKAFNTSDQHYAEAVQRIEEFFADVEERLSDGRKSILSGDKIDYVDISLAAISSFVFYRLRVSVPVRRTRCVWGWNEFHQRCVPILSGGSPITPVL